MTIFKIIDINNSDIQNPPTHSIEQKNSFPIILDKFMLNSDMQNPPTHSTKQKNRFPIILINLC